MIKNTLIMKVSIITATFNSEKTILDTLKSLEQQTYKNIEYIVIDGASSDKTVELIQNNSTRVTKIICEPDQGIYDALNKGIYASTGDVIGFLHSDDLFASNIAVENIVNKFKSDGCDAVYGDLKYVAQDNISKVIRVWKSGEYNLSSIKSGWMPPHPTFFMKRELYEKFGGFDLGFKIAADYDSLLRYLWTNQISLAYLPEVLTLMRMGGASNRNLKNILQKTKEDINILSKNKVPVFRAILMKNISKIPQFIFLK